MARRLSPSLSLSLSRTPPPPPLPSVSRNEARPSWEVAWNGDCDSRPAAVQSFCSHDLSNHRKKGAFVYVDHLHTPYTVLAFSMGSRVPRHGIVAMRTMARFRILSRFHSLPCGSKEIYFVLRSSFQRMSFISPKCLCGFADSFI